MQTPWSSSRRPTAGTAIVLAATLAVTGCRSDAPPAATIPPAPSQGLLNAPLYGPDDPALAEAVRGAVIQLDPATGRLSGVLARSWHHNRTHTTYTFRLRRSVATQVAARWTAVHHQLPTALPGLRRVTAVGRRVVLVRLAAGDPGWPAYLADPVTWLESGGAYRIVARSPKTIDLERNPGYAGPPAPIRRVHLHLYSAGDLDGAFADFRAGRLDYAAIPPGQIALAKSDPKLARDVVSQPRLELVAVGIGMLAPGLRQAVALATPADAAAADVGPGSAVPADGLLPQGLAEYLPRASPYHFDPGAARAAASGSVPALRLAYPDDAFHRRIAGVVLGGFALAGLRVEPHPIRPARYRPALVARQNPLWLIDVSTRAPSSEGMLSALAAAAPQAGIVPTGDPEEVQRTALTEARIAPLRYELTTYAVRPRVSTFALDVTGITHLAQSAVDK